MTGLQRKGWKLEGKQLWSDLCLTEHAELHSHQTCCKVKDAREMILSVTLIRGVIQHELMTNLTNLFLFCVNVLNDGSNS